MGEGADFSVGADIAELEGTAVGRTNLKEAGRFIRALARTKAPIVASVRGRAAGIGATLLFHCDLVYVADNVEIMTHFVKLGLVPEAASTLLAPARIGYARAFALLAACETMSAKDAITCGLANHLCGPGDVDTMARAAAERLAELPASALQSTKSLMRSVDSMLAAMDREGTLFDELVKSNEATAAFDAFRARHRPTPRQIS
jgi:enoyl-CoA hydratase/carnithine racemase